MTNMQVCDLVRTAMNVMANEQRRRDLWQGGMNVWAKQFTMRPFDAYALFNEQFAVGSTIHIRMPERLFDTSPSVPSPAVRS